MAVHSVRIYQRALSEADGSNCSGKCLFFLISQWATWPPTHHRLCDLTNHPQFVHAIWLEWKWNSHSPAAMISWCLKTLLLPPVLAKSCWFCLTWEPKSAWQHINITKERKGQKVKRCLSEPWRDTRGTSHPGIASLMLFRSRQQLPNPTSIILFLFSLPAL